MRKIILFAGALGIGMALTAMADEVIDTNSITASASSEYDGTRTAAKLLDGYADTDLTHEWLSEEQSGTVPTAVSNQWVRFDLGRACDLSQMKIWNYNGWGPPYGDSTYRGVKSAHIQTSDELDGTYTTISGITGWDIGGNLAISPQVDPYIPPNILVFPEGTRTRFVRIFVNSNWGDPDGAQSGSEKMVGLVEVELWHDPPRVEVIDRTTITASASSEYDTTRTAAKLLDGYTDTNYEHEWLSETLVGPQTPYASNQWVRFDLGKVYDLYEMQIWNYNEWDGGDWTDRGVKSAHIQTSDTLDGTYTTIPDMGGWDADGNLARSPYEDPYIHPNVLFFPEGIRARYVRIFINSNWALDTGPYVGLVEVAFWQLLPPRGTVIAIQ